MQQHTVPYADRIIRRNGETWPRTRNPPAWSQHRLEMTGALTWFHSQQGGVQLSLVSGKPDNFFVLGILIGGHAAPNSYIDAEVIITSINGIESMTTGPTANRHDAMEATIAAGRLIGILFEAGSTQQSTTTGVRRSRDRGAQLMPCSNMPTEEPERQNCWIADYFLPTHMWGVKVPDRTGYVWMVRLEKYKLEEQSWWANVDHGMPPRNQNRDFSIITPTELCGACNSPSIRIFEEFFTCLNQPCTNSWCQPDGSVIPVDRVLNYTDAFLKQRRARPLQQVVFPTGESDLIEDFQTWWNTNYLGPQLRNEPITDANFVQRMASLLRGFACPYCNMVNRRIRWWEWHCRNVRCPFKLAGAPPRMTVQQASLIGRSLTSSSDLTRHSAYSGMRDFPDFTVQDFELGEGCRVSYFKPKPHTNAMPGSSNDLYMMIQTLAANGTVDLERRGMRTQAGESLSGHFAANYGERYIFTARVPTTPFAQAPPAIQDSLTRVNNWVAPCRPADEPPANELYMAGYLSGQAMNWHDDGEIGLGQVITTYTLGGQGVFKISIKPAYNSGFYGRNRTRTVRTRNIGYDPVIPGCAMQRERTELRRRLIAGEIDNAQWQTEFRQLMNNQHPERGTLLVLPVSHGDIVVMYGPNCQRYLDHAVDVTTPMRFALTYRHIKPEHHRAEVIQNLDRRLQYDIQYDPGDDWDPAQPPMLSPVASRQNSEDLELPALSPGDPGNPNDRQAVDDEAPPAQRRRLNDDGPGLDPAHHQAEFQNQPELRPKARFEILPQFYLRLPAAASAPVPDLAHAPSQVSAPSSPTRRNRTIRDAPSPRKRTRAATPSQEAASKRTTKVPPKSGSASPSGSASGSPPRRSGRLRGGPK